MSFVNVAIGGAASIIGGAIASKGVKDAAKTAAQGASEEIAFNRESRDIALEMQEPYRKAGVAALDKLGRMTGLIDSSQSFTHSGGSAPAWETYGRGPSGERGTEGRQFNYDGAFSSALPRRGIQGGEVPTSINGEPVTPEQRQFLAYRALSDRDPAAAERFKASYIQNNGQSNWDQIFGRNYGGRIYGRALGGHMYNVNETGPESVYAGGSYTRSAVPRTIPAQDGYVQPNIQGRYTGGPTLGVIDPNQALKPQKEVVDPRLNRPGDYYPSWMPDKYGGSPGGGDSSFTGGDVQSMPAQESVTIDGATGQPVNTPSQGTPAPVENPYPFETDPGYQFRFNEGQRMLERGAAARGGLLSGGFARKAIRYGQDFATQEYTNIYNRIANIAGLGQTSAQSGGTAAQYAGAAMGGAASDRALSSAYGQMGATNAWANAANQIAQLPWGDIFGPQQTTWINRSKT